jgi:signal peptidase I
MRILIIIAAVSFLFCGISCSKRRGKVGSSSMNPTFMKGDAVMTDISAYQSAAPSRWDVIVFEAPPAPESIFMSRVVGMPGETIEFRESGLHIDGEPISIPARLKIPLYLPADPSIVIPKVPRPPDPYEIPPGHYFVMGDNVRNALDSRYWGSVPKNKIRGKVVEK